LESEKEQEDILAKSTINNEAYRTLIEDVDIALLKDYYYRKKYINQLKENIKKI